MSNGTVCKDMSTLGSVTVELTDESEVTADIIEEIRITVEKETGYSTIISVIDSNTIMISIDNNDSVALEIIKYSLEQCIIDA